MRARAAALAPHLVAAIGCLAHATQTLAKIPLADWKRRPETPYDLTSAGEAVQLHLFFSKAQSHIPVGASVGFVALPRDPAVEDRWRKFARSLLPGRRLVPPGTYADYAVVAGGRPPGALEPEPPLPGSVLRYESPYGSVWKLP